MFQACGPSPHSFLCGLIRSPTQAPQRCETDARAAGAATNGVSVGASVTLAANRARSTPAETGGASEAGVPAVVAIFAGLHIVYRYKLPIPRSRTRPQGPSRTFAGCPLGRPAALKRDGEWCPIDRRSRADRPSLTGPDCHSPPTQVAAGAEPEPGPQAQARSGRLPLSMDRIGFRPVQPFVSCALLSSSHKRRACASCHAPQRVGRMHEKSYQNGTLPEVHSCDSQSKGDASGRPSAVTATAAAGRFGRAAAAR